MCSKFFLNRTCLGVLFGLLSTGVNATLLTGSSGNLAGSADFSVNENTSAVLAHTSSTDVLVPSDVLATVFFDISGNSTLNSVSATLASSGGLVFCGAGGHPADGAGGGESGREKESGVDSYAGSHGNSVSDSGGVSGFPMFSDADSAEASNIVLESLQSRTRRALAYRALFRPSNGPRDVLQNGLLLVGVNKTAGYFGEITKPAGLIKNSVTRTLTGISANDVLPNVYFQSGTAFGESAYAGNCLGGYCQPLTIKDPSESEPDSLWLLRILREGYWVVVRWAFTVFGIDEQ